MALVFYNVRKGNEAKNPAILGFFFNLVPRVFVPLDQRSENESSGSNHFEIIKEIAEFCPSGLTQSSSMMHA